MATQAEIETPVVVSLDQVANVDAAAISSPKPTDVAAVAAESKSTPQSVTAPAAPTYQTISTAEVVTDEVLNRNAETLAASVNQILSDWSTVLNGIISDVGSDAGAQVIEFNNKIELMRAGINSALADVRNANVTQNADIAAAVNARMGVVAGNMNKLLVALEEIDGKVVALDSVYGTDQDIAAKVANINAQLESMNAADLDIAGLLTNTAAELDAVLRIQRKEVTVAAGTGTYAFNLDSEGIGAFAAVADYSCSIEVVGNPQVAGTIMHKTATGFEIVLKSQGVHFVPQPWDAATVPVAVEVTVAHAPRTQVSV